MSELDPLCEFSPQTLTTIETAAVQDSFVKPYSIYPLSSSTNTLLPNSSLDQLVKASPITEDSKTLFHSSMSETANEKMRLLQQDYEVNCCGSFLRFHRSC